MSYSRRAAIFAIASGIGLSGCSSADPEQRTVIITENSDYHLSVEYAPGSNIDDPEIVVTLSPRSISKASYVLLRDGDDQLAWEKADAEEVTLSLTTPETGTTYEVELMHRGSVLFDTHTGGERVDVVAFELTGPSS